MIVCQCNLISTEEIERTIIELLHEDPWQLIVPLQVYHAMEKRGRCCGCFPNVVDIIVRTVKAYHEANATPQAKIISLVDKIQEKHQACVTAQMLMRHKAKKTA